MKKQASMMVNAIPEVGEADESPDDSSINNVESRGGKDNQPTSNCLIF
jgi:hypothetical protein